MDEVQLRLTHLADAADTLRLKVRGGSGALRYCGGSGATVMGPAFTVRQRAIAADVDGTTLRTRHGEAASRLAKAGDILVIAVDGGLDVATWGEAMTLRALNSRLAGLIIGGNLRDVDSISKLGLPVLYRSTSPFRSLGRLETAELMGEVVIEGVSVRGGDIIAMDSDGFLCIPSEHFAAIRAGARQIALKELARDSALRAASAT